METQNEKYQRYLHSDKWRAIAKKRLEIDGYRCVMCGTRGTTENPLEIHHLSYRYLFHEERRIYEDLATLCHCCHLATHNLMNRVTNEDGRHGWKDNRYLPQITVLTIAGDYLENREETEEENGDNLRVFDWDE